MTKLLSSTFLFLFSLSICKAQYNHEFGSTDECYRKTFKVVAWVLTDTMNLTIPLTQGVLQTAIDGANSEFEDICVDFQLCEYNVLPNHRQDTIIRGIHDEEIAALYRKKNVINMYFATTIVDTAMVELPCGYTSRGTDTIPNDTNLRDAIFFGKACVNPRSMSVLLGTYFGLFPTFHDANGVELEDGSNCATSGDLICDTKADYVEGVNGRIENCMIDRRDQTQQPETGLTYEPPMCNIMSFYNVGCDSYFTRGQLNRMLSIMKTGRSYLW